jgi:hypothetical protein
VSSETCVIGCVGIRTFLIVAYVRNYSSFRSQVTYVCVCVCVCVRACVPRYSRFIKGRSWSAGIFSRRRKISSRIMMTPSTMATNTNENSNSFCNIICSLESSCSQLIHLNITCVTFLEANVNNEFQRS